MEKEKEQKLMLMDPDTGEVHSLQHWIATKPMWEGSLTNPMEGLIQVVKDANGKWVPKHEKAIG